MIVTIAMLLLVVLIVAATMMGMLVLLLTIVDLPEAHADHGHDDDANLCQRVGRLEATPIQRLPSSWWGRGVVVVRWVRATPPATTE